MYLSGAAHVDRTGNAPHVPLEMRKRHRRLLLVDDHELVRYGAKALFTELLDVSLEWLEASTLKDALEIYGRETDIDAVLLDLNLSDCKGLQGLRQFVHEFPRARIAIFSATSKEVEFMAGVGPEWVHARQPGMAANSISGEVALDFMFWSAAKHRFGWYLEPEFDHNFGRGHEQSAGISGGLLIAIF